MPQWLFVGELVLIALLVLDRLLLLMERRGWIHYRRNGLSRGGASYHTLQLSSIFNPGMQAVIEAKYEEEEQQDESGEPPGPSDANDDTADLRH